MNSAFVVQKFALLPNLDKSAFRILNTKQNVK